MGGKGAKERRKLARLAANEGADTAKKETNENTTDPHRNNKTNRYEKMQNRFPRAQSRPQSRRPEGNFGRRAPPDPRFSWQRAKPPTTKQEKKKPKVKKPKHLKRKLEKISEEDGEAAARQKLVDELKQFEARKSALRTTRPAPKRQKPNVPPTKTKVRETSTMERKVPNEDLSTRLVDNDDTKEVEPSPSTVTEAVPAAKKEARSTISQSVVDENSDSDSDVSLEDATRRQRGRRRRGRKSTEEQSKSNPGSHPNEPATSTKFISPTKIQIPADTPNDTTDKSDPSKKTAKKDDKRRCIGRKPVTEYVVGQRYPGKVVYTKHFGAFIDIGCHSDAFCHVSRVRDDYVESISDVLSIGQEVSARVVEVDRRAKKITVSLQSDARVEDELASIEARKLRKERQQAKGKRSTSELSSSVAASSSQSPVQPVAPKEQAPAAAPAPPMDESMMSPAELKRARKLARRAARREQQAQTGLAA